MAIGQPISYKADASPHDKNDLREYFPQREEFRGTPASISLTHSCQDPLEPGRWVGGSHVSRSSAKTAFSCDVCAWQLKAKQPIVYGDPKIRRVVAVLQRCIQH
jgi:hypothetical protein